MGFFLRRFFSSFFRRFLRPPVVRRKPRLSLSFPLRLPRSNANARATHAQTHHAHQQPRQEHTLHLSLRARAPAPFPLLVAATTAAPPPPPPHQKINPQNVETCKERYQGQKGALHTPSTLLLLLRRHPRSRSVPRSSASSARTTTPTTPNPPALPQHPRAPACFGLLQRRGGGLPGRRRERERNPDAMGGRKLEARDPEADDDACPQRRRPLSPSLSLSLLWKNEVARRCRRRGRCRKKACP